MKDFTGKVAVVTGAASGIGRALADRGAQEGMKVVLADIEQSALDRAAAEIAATGAAVLAVRTDVSKAEDVDALARKAVDTFGGVHLLFNNAGVGAGTTAWGSSLRDWEWVLGVNLWGVIHGLHSFVPLMLSQGGEGHIVNTASIAGLVSGPGLAAYKVSKHGVVSLSETLYAELQQAGAPIGVSVLCPFWVQTRIMDAERNRPAALQNAPADQDIPPEIAAGVAAMRQAVDQGIPPEQVAEAAFAAIRDGQFYVVVPAEAYPIAQARAADILYHRNPGDTAREHEAMAASPEATPAG
ncbi:MAG TPA: SDR family NAD(P)-dependent oxidoreductase [Chloroflexia bacterium]